MLPEGGPPPTPPEPTSPGAGAPPRKRRSLRFLTPELIVATAARVVEEDGPDALTFRRLGSELGVDHTAVLRHFGNKDDLTLALTDWLLADALGGFEPAATWRDTLSELAWRIRRSCLAHPAVAVYAVGRTARRDSEFRGADTVLGALFSAGLEGAEAARVYRALVAVALSYAGFEAAHLALDPDARAGDRQAWSREYLAASPEAYPNIAAVAPHLAAIEAEDQFTTILDLFLDAVELRASRASGHD